MNTADIPRTDRWDEPRILRVYGALESWFDKNITPDSRGS